jgi:stearoyl-CoA desaturase (delta-9 desaturase)
MNTASDHLSGIHEAAARSRAFRDAGFFASKEEVARMPLLGSYAHTWWVPLLYVAIFGHITNVCVTLYLHRSMTHEGVIFKPVVSHFMRFWLWLTTGMKTRDWVAVHRKHHAFSDRPGDPHSPVEEGFWAIALGGVFFYRKATLDTAMLDKYGRGCPDDAIERRVYSPFSASGILFVLLPLDLLLFGWGMGLLVWSGAAIWMPIMGNIINGVGHALGYRNFETKDHSHNIYPFGFWIVGEELHNNHHADPRSAKFKAQWWEFDIGWSYIRMLSALHLAKVVYAREMKPREFRKKFYSRDSAHGLKLGAEEAALAQPAISELERAV